MMHNLDNDGPSQYEKPKDVNKQKAASSADMHTLESLLGWEANNPEDNISLKRIIKLVNGHLPLGWK
ncbi:unnamed protein product [Parnassius apollo]|uniref:(apollo) hypothetical protein n=1 Tax=Parnassius apollo TaxID=110799 RepID=A0A8S3XIA0_PARAO|nr:unnamed protein product [Parnassius apollo]